MNKTPLQKASDLLDSCRLRKTQPRQEILSILLQADHPLTQEQIADRIGSQAPDKTTIYRTLMALIRHNLVHQAYLRDRTRHFELAHHCQADQCHPHFTCTDCGQTHCLYDTVIPAVKNIPDGFLVQHRQLRLEGICADCRTHSGKQNPYVE
jgi:Fur family ferric uptake transcriptional regulator